MKAVELPKPGNSGIFLELKIPSRKALFPANSGPAGIPGNPVDHGDRGISVVQNYVINCTFV